MGSLVNYRDKSLDKIETLNDMIFNTNFLVQIDEHGGN